MLRFNKWISDCLEVVASNPRASKLDKYLVSWVRLMKITEDLGSSLSFEDPSNMADLAEPSVQLKVTGFEKLLEAWKKTSEPDVNGTVPMSPIFRVTDRARRNHVAVSLQSALPP
jgi:hypothetical protein